MVPNSPGGGYDLTARTAVKIMEDDDITGRVEVFNVIGAGGTVAMARLMNEKGNNDLMMMMGLGRGRRHLHQRVQGTRLGRDGAGEDDRGAGRHFGSGGFAVQDGAGLRRGVEGRSVQGHHRRRFVTGRARPPVSDGNGQGRRCRPEGGQLRLLRRRRRSADRAAGQEDHGRHVGSRANSSTRSRRASCGCSRCPATSGSRASMRRR